MASYGRNCIARIASMVSVLTLGAGWQLHGGELDAAICDDAPSVASRVVLRRDPSSERRAPCELLLSALPKSSLQTAGLLRVHSTARCAEVYLQGAVDNAPAYVCTLRGQPSQDVQEATIHPSPDATTAALPDAASGSDATGGVLDHRASASASSSASGAGGSATGSSCTFNPFFVDVDLAAMAGWRTLCLRLLHLQDKEACTIYGMCCLPAPAGAPAEAAMTGADVSEPLASVAAASASIGRLAASTGPLISQVAELRMMLQSLTAGARKFTACVLCLAGTFTSPVMKTG